MTKINFFAIKKQYLRKKIYVVSLLIIYYSFVLLRVVIKTPVYLLNMTFFEKGLLYFFIFFARLGIQLYL